MKYFLCVTRGLSIALVAIAISLLIGCSPTSFSKSAGFNKEATSLSTQPVSNSCLPFHPYSVDSSGHVQEQPHSEDFISVSKTDADIMLKLVKEGNSQERQCWYRIVKNGHIVLHLAESRYHIFQQVNDGWERIESGSISSYDPERP